MEFLEGCVVCEVEWVWVGEVERVWCALNSFVVWWSRVYNQCVGGMTPSALMHGRERIWRDWMSTVVREVVAREVHGTCPVTGGGVMVMV